MFKINVDAVKKRFAEQAQASDKTSVMLKAMSAGKHSFRAVPYPHNSSEGQPFCEKFYHYGIDKTALYCPKRNDGLTCAVCEFVWPPFMEAVNATRAAQAEKAPNKNKIEQLKAAQREWGDRLPKLNVFVVGVVRGRETEGPKFLRITSDDRKKSKNHEKIYNWFFDTDTENWLDTEEGIDIVLEYEALDAGRSKALRGAKSQLKDMSLARKSTPFGTAEELEKFVAAIPNIDSIFPVRTPEEMVDALKRWMAAPETTVNDGAGTVAAADTTEEQTPQTTAAKPAGVSAVDLDAKLKSLMGID